MNKKVTKKLYCYVDESGQDADAIAGLVRYAEQGNKKSKSITQKAAQKNIINRLN
ncbi:MAG: hypothetical protein US31_C0014G0014 [Berkelbacteria bacterium GW2011_GWA1_36_9]|uniref:DUF3800 domain-containing protein n=1 Tax=Berkelbacteria bacterium GW2011_GWA1_36_9 TaxID=1618331 RepID=A0A0G0FFK4_9BACT|nr:MAG: hypothetical protein US31_C0014G0014 [Berkelbacteria bacterium GW2011_GWA1_36_9]